MKKNQEMAKQKEACLLSANQWGPVKLDLRVYEEENVSKSAGDNCVCRHCGHRGLPGRAWSPPFPGTVPALGYVAVAKSRRAAGPPRTRRALRLHLDRKGAGEQAGAAVSITSLVRAAGTVSKGKTEAPHG